MKKKLFLIIIAFSMLSSLSAQVGVNTSKIMEFALLEVHNDTIRVGGILLPKMTQLQRDSLSIKHAADWGDGTPAAGLSIFNLDLSCNEYWNGYTWISICSSTAVANINLEYRTAPVKLDNDFNYDGTDLNPNGHTGNLRKDLVVTTTGGAELCTDGYIFSVVAGAAYTKIITPTDYGFSLVMDANPNALNRTAIIRVTDKCTSGSIDYIFNQVFGDICPTASTYPNLTSIPVINANDNLSSPVDMCNSGSVQLFVTDATYDILDTDPAPNYIWTYNGSIIGSGQYITANQAGTYRVYIDAVGCTAPYVSDPFIINSTETSSASSPLFLKVNNGGVICNGNMATITASGNIGTDRVYWYRNGIYLSTGAPGIATLDVITEGTYTATVGNSSCASAPSNEIEIITKSGTPITPFADTCILVNGISLDKNPIYCSSGILDLRISPAVSGVLYTWYINDNIIGTSTGNGLSYNLANLGTPFPSTISLTVVASKPGDASSCDVSISSGATTVTKQNVDEPYITGDNYFCSNGSATLQASADESGNSDYNAKSFRWINTTSVPRTYYPSATGWNTNSFLIVKNAGDYQLMVTTLPNGQGCSSQTLTPFSVKLQGVAQLRTGAYPSVYNAGDTVMMNVFCDSENDYPSGRYVWTSSNPSMVTIKNQNDPKYASVIFDPALTDDTVKIYIHTDNNCGSSNTIVYNIAKASIVNDVNIIVNGPNSTCGGISFTVPNISVYTDIDPTTKISWEVISDDVIAPTRLVSGAYNEICYIPFTKNANTLQVRAKATGSIIGDIPPSTISYDASNIVDGNGYLTATGDVSTGDPGSIDPASAPINGSSTGAFCFDVNPSKDPSRDFFDTTTKYQYYLSTNISPIQNLTWTLSNRSSNGDVNIVTSMVDNGDGSVDLTFDASNGAVIPTEISPVTVMLIANYNDGNCTYQINTVITLQDGPCCPTSVTQGIYTYPVGSFGRAGCWMTSNIRKTNPYSGPASISPGNNAEQRTYYYIGYSENGVEIQEYNNGDPQIGWSYSRNGIMNESKATDIAPSDALKTTSSIQGICPTGWVVPSAEDWRSLDAEMRANGSQYGDQSVRTTNYRDYYYLAKGRDGKNTGVSSDIPTGASHKTKGFAAYMSTFANYYASRGTGGTDPLNTNKLGNIDGAEGVAFFATSSSPAGNTNRYVLSGVRLPAANSSDNMQIGEFPYKGVGTISSSYAVRCMKKDTNKRIK